MNLIDIKDISHTANSLTEVKKIENYWNYDLRQRDYFNSPLTVVVELQSSALTIAVNKSIITLPVDWFVVVCDKMSGAMDTIAVHELTNTNFRLLVVGPTHHTVTELGYRVVDFTQSTTFFHPVLLKNQLMCTEIVDGKWILVSPNDCYQKYLKNMSLADFLM